MIDEVIFAKSRADLVAATKALDRVLLWNHYVVPQWTYGKIAHRPLGPLRPSRSAAAIRHVRLSRSIWWWDAAQGGEDGQPLVKMPTLPELREPRAPVRLYAPSGRAPGDGAGAMIQLTRRRALVARGATLPLAAAHRGVLLRRADEEIESHGLSAFGDLAYPPDFQHFRYVDPQCAEGRHLLADRPEPAVQSELPHLQLAQQLHPQGRRGAGDGAHLRDAHGALPATSRTPCTALPPRRCGARPTASPTAFFIRPAGQVSRRHHGSPRTTSPSRSTSLKDKGHPIITQSLRDFVGAEAHDDAIVDRALCAETRPRRAAVRRRPADLLARLLHGKAVRRNRRSRCRSAPGPTRSAASSPAAIIEYQRVKDWWGAELPVARGQNNFDIVRFEYYRDREVGFEGFSAKNYLFREEFTSRTWATRYDFPAMKDGRVKRDMLPDDTPSGAQGWFINTRRAKFADPRLREALCDAFDFEWTNKTIMYGSYERTVVGVSELRHDGARPARAPRSWRCSSRSAATFRTRSSASPMCRRSPTAPARTARCCARPRSSLQEAGCVDQGRQARIAERRARHHRVPDRRADVRAAPHAVHQEPRRRSASRRRCASSIRCSIAPGATASTSTSPSTGSAFPRPPGDSLRSYFSSQAAALKGSNNLAGIADPAIDALIDAIIAAELAARARHRLPRARPRDPLRPLLDTALVQAVALDRLLGRVRPAPRPSRAYARGIPETWWYDRDKAAKIERAG